MAKEMTPVSARRERRSVQAAGVQWYTAARAIEVAIRESKGHIEVSVAEKMVLRGLMRDFAEREEKRVAELRKIEDA